MIKGKWQTTCCNYYQRVGRKKSSWGKKVDWSSVDCTKLIATTLRAMEAIPWPKDNFELISFENVCECLIVCVSVKLCI